MCLNMAECEPQNKQNVFEGFMSGLISRSSYQKCSDTTRQIDVNSVVWDGGYRVPGGYMGRVHVGRGPGLDLVTRIKPIPVGTHNLYVHGGYS